MNLAKGLTFSAVGAIAGSVVWILAIKLSGWNLWVLAPIVGGAAGFGMMRGTQMKGGAPAGMIAAALTLVAIFGARYFIVTQEVEGKTAVSEEQALVHLTEDAAAAMDKRGIPTLDENGDYTPRVQRKAADAWEQMVPYEREQYIASLREQNRAAAGVLTPLGLLFDFGIFGTICSLLAAGTALKTGSMRLEKALVERGLSSEEKAPGLASKMRAEDSSRASSTGSWALPMAAKDDRPVPRIRLVATEEATPEKQEADPARKDVA